MNKINSLLDQIIFPKKHDNTTELIWYLKKQQDFNYKEFIVITQDKIQLSSIFIQKKQQEKSQKWRLIIYTHSYGSNKSEGCDSLGCAAKFDFDLCIYDSRGSGNSMTSPITFGYKESLDLFYILLFCYIKYDYWEFVLWGRSIGCNAVLQLILELKNNYKICKNIENFSQLNLL